MTETKVLPVALTQEQRKRLGVMAADKCVAMTELLRWWIEEKWSAHNREVSVESGGLVAAIKKGKQLGVVPSVKVSTAPVSDTPIGDLEVPVRTCWKCKGKVEKWTMDKLGHAWCADCIEEQRNAIP